MMKQFTTLALLILLSTLFAACAGQETPTPTSAPTAEPIATQAPAETPTEEPTKEPTKEPTAEPTPEPTTEPTVQPSPTAELIEHEIVGNTWFWVKFQDQAEINDIIVPDPENYTLTLQPDGTASIQADCNQLSWTYELESSSLTFNTLGPATLAFCGEASLDQQYLAFLGQMATFVNEDDQLFLNLQLDSGNMVFNSTGEPVAADEPSVTLAPDELPTDFIQLDLQGLADTYAWQVVDASPIPPGPGGQGVPQHIVLGFDGQNPLEMPYNERKALYLFPVKAYEGLYGASGSDVVTMQVERLEQLIAEADARQGMPEGWMPLLPPPNSLMDRWVQFADLDFVNGRGVRYVSDSPLRQSIGVWTNETMGYYYQGLTENREFYISFLWPVSTDTLPDTVDGASDELKQQASASRESYDQYQETLKAELNALSPADWTPDLLVFDAMISSLTFNLP